MTGTKKWEDVRRSTPEELADHQRWAAFAVRGATLGDLRKLCGRTQEQVGKAMGISAVEAGRMERRNDVQISTVVRFLKALDGELELFARFGQHGEKVVALRIGEFNHQAFAEMVAEQLQAGVWKKDTELDLVMARFRETYPLQPAPTQEQLQVALVMAKELLMERKAPKFAALVEYFKGAARR